MRQHAILSCFILFIGWGVFFGNTLFYMLNPIVGWEVKALYALVLPTCFLLMVWRKEKLKLIVFKSNVLGFLGLLGLLGVRLYAELSGHHALQTLAVLLMVPMILLASLGLKAFWALCFPSLAVLLAYPFYDGLMNAVEVRTVATFNHWLPLNLEQMHQAAEASGVVLMPIIRFLAYWVIAGLFYGYIRYEALGRRLFFYGLLVVSFLGIAVIELLSLGWIAELGGVEILSRLNISQFNQVAMGLSLLLVAYLLAVLCPHQPKLRRMMADNRNFMILVDRHSHWFALTLTTLAMMVLSVWLGSNLYQMSISVMDLMG